MSKNEKNEGKIIEVIHRVCCGLDVHKKHISACIAITESDGSVRYEIKEFATTTYQIKKLRDWIDEHDCPIVAMESTGIFWRPIHNILENHVEVILVNAKHVKNVPGRKTDIRDCKWLAELLRVGLLKGSFIPPKEVRQWKDLVTLRKSYSKNANDFKRRVHKLFETANIKIGTVISDIFGKTGRNLINLLLDPNAQITQKDIEQCAKGSLRKKVWEIHQCIDGFFEDHHRIQLKMLMDTIDYLESKAAELTERLEELMAPHEELLSRLDDIPGVDKLAAQSIIAHVGYTLEAFSNVHNFASWAGLCPGNNESAGKRKSGKSPVQKHSFRTLLIECAWAGKNKKGSYFNAKFHNLEYRIGSKKAAGAIAHKISNAIFFIIKKGETFKDLGEDYLKKKNKEKRLKNLEKHAKELGFKLVTA